MNSLEFFFYHRLQERQKQGNRRALKHSSPSCVDFASNDYLGLLEEGILHAMVEEEMAKLGIGKKKCYGSTGSRLLTGHSAYFKDLEEEIASFHQAEAGLIFNCGYLANLGLLATITRPDDSVIYDSCMHASFFDALKLCRVKAYPFRHQNLSHLAKRLQGVKGRIFVCIESIYSCDGSQADLKMIYQLCQQTGACLIVDEAHATGCLGANGEGAVQAAGLQEHVFARLHTFGKALGAQGAILLGSALLRDYLINFSRTLIYTTALPLYHLIIIRCAYRTLKASSHFLQALQRNITYFRKMIRGKNLPFTDSDTAIQCFKISGNHAARAIVDRLQAKGFEVRSLMYPTVRRGQECLRICLHAFNTFAEIDGLLENLQEIRENKGNA